MRTDLSFCTFEERVKKYREFICEDFHFACQIYMYEDGTEVVRVHDACHSYLYTNK